MTRANEFLDLEATNFRNVPEDLCLANGHNCDTWFSQTELSLPASDGHGPQRVWSPPAMNS